MLKRLFKKTNDTPKYVNHTWDSKKNMFIPKPDYHGKKLDEQSKVTSKSDVKFIKI